MNLLMHAYRTKGIEWNKESKRNAQKWCQKCLASKYLYEIVEWHWFFLPFFSRSSSLSLTSRVCVTRNTYHVYHILYASLVCHSHRNTLRTCVVPVERLWWWWWLRKFLLWFLWAIIILHFHFLLFIIFTQCV